MKILLLLLMCVPGALWAQSLSIFRGDCWDEGAFGCAPSGSVGSIVDTTITCGTIYLYRISSSWCSEFSDLPTGWELSADTSYLRFECFVPGVYSFDVVEWIEGPDPGGLGTVVCERSEFVTLTVLPRDTTWLTVNTCDPDSVGVSTEKFLTPNCHCDSVVVTEYLLHTCDERDELVGDIFFPNVFKPNHDGINDTFYPFAGMGVVEEIIEMQVYDRWGNWIWHNSHFLPNDSTQGWDGTFRGELCEQDVHVWSAEVRFTNGSTRLYKGDIFLMRGYTIYPLTFA